MVVLFQDLTFKFIGSMAVPTGIAWNQRQLLLVFIFVISLSSGRRNHHRKSSPLVCIIFTYLKHFFFHLYLFVIFTFYCPTVAYHVGLSAIMGCLLPPSANTRKMSIIMTEKPIWLQHLLSGGDVDSDLVHNFLLFWPPY